MHRKDCYRNSRRLGGTTMCNRRFVRPLESGIESKMEAPSLREMRQGGGIVRDVKRGVRTAIKTGRMVRNVARDIASAVEDQSKLIKKDLNRAIDKERKYPQRTVGNGIMKEELPGEMLKKKILKNLKKQVKGGSLEPTGGSLHPSGSGVTPTGQDATPSTGGALSLAGTKAVRMTPKKIRLPADKSGLHNNVIRHVAIPKILDEMGLKPMVKSMRDEIKLPKPIKSLTKPYIKRVAKAIHPHVHKHVLNHLESDDDIKMSGSGMNSILSHLGEGLFNFVKNLYGKHPPIVLQAGDGADLVMGGALKTKKFFHKMKNAYHKAMPTLKKIAKFADKGIDTAEKVLTKGAPVLEGLAVATGNPELLPAIEGVKVLAKHAQTAKKHKDKLKEAISKKKE
jgi:hypothetical protein